MFRRLGSVAPSFTRTRHYFAPDYLAERLLFTLVTSATKDNGSWRARKGKQAIAYQVEGGGAYSSMSSSSSISPSRGLRRRFSTLVFHTRQLRAPGRGIARRRRGGRDCGLTCDELRHILGPAAPTPRELENILDPWEEVRDPLNAGD
jgi:hypothetical protein